MLGSREDVKEIWDFKEPKVKKLREHWRNKSLEERRNLEGFDQLRKLTIKEQENFGEQWN